MPTPGQDETKEEFISRCIPIVLGDGTAKDAPQASAICYSIWEQSQEKEKESAMYVQPEQIERRCLPSAEIRIDGTPRHPRITGYAAVFNTWADIGGWFRESIRPGAFSKTIKENDIRALLNHDENYVLARNRSGTLSLHEDDKGLAVEIDPVAATWANDLLLSMKRGDVNQMSFGFTVNKAENDFETNERTLLDVTLFDVSVVTFPAYPTTSAQVRCAFERKGQPASGIRFAAPPAETNEWEDLDRLIAKIKAGEPLTDEDVRVLHTRIPGLSEPARKPLGDPGGAGLQTTPTKDTRPQRMRWVELIDEVNDLYARKA